MNNNAILMAFLFLSGCELPPIALNNVTADQDDWLKKNPEAAEAMDQAAIPQDNKLHLSLSVTREKRQDGSKKNGWEAQVSGKVAWPLVFFRPPWPRKTYPPDRQPIDPWP